MFKKKIFWLLLIVIVLLIAIAVRVFDQWSDNKVKIPERLEITFKDQKYDLNVTQINQGPLQNADYVYVQKAKRLMILFKGQEPFRVYHIALGDNPVGHKRKQGDERTPEGDYILDWRNPNSIAYLSLHISYPNQTDEAWAEQHGVDPGGNIMIHGVYNSFKGSQTKLQSIDWTDGCIAVRNDEMDEVWKAVKNGTPIRIE